MDNIENEIILKSFSKFVTGSNLLEDDYLREILADEVFSMYIINTIKQLFQQYDNEKKWIDKKLEDAFEIENFIDIIDAYLSGFRDLDQTQIVSWLTELKKSVDQIKSTNNESSSQISSQEGASSTVNQCEKQESSNDAKPVENFKYEPNVMALSEMFPKMSLKEINLIYKKTNKNYERSIDELLIIKDGSIVNDSSDEDTLIKLELNEEEKKALKEKTVQKFGFIAVKENEDARSHVTVPKWDENKKMIRYFESKVVSTKGEKYFEPKTEEDEELAKQMKKTYVNLKPARKYRFH